MPGRLAQAFTWEELHAHYGIAAMAGAQPWKPRYNISPTTNLSILRMSDAGKLEAAVVRFGLIPTWSRDDKTFFHNARAESAAVKPAFREAFRRRHCLLPVNGFYEWTEKGKVKLPYFIRPADSSQLAFAGLWERWIPKEDGRAIESATLMTCDSNQLLLPFDERMPVMLDARGQTMWLDHRTKPKALDDLVAPRDWPEMKIYRVSRRVNSGKVDGPECIEPNDD